MGVVVGGVQKLRMMSTMVLQGVEQQMLKKLALLLTCVDLHGSTAGIITIENNLIILDSAIIYHG